MIKTEKKTEVKENKKCEFNQNTIYNQSDLTQ